MKRQIQSRKIQDYSVDRKFDKISNFLYKHVATKEDLKEYASLRQIVSFKDEILTAIDSLARQIKVYHQEMIMLTRRVERMEEWIKKVSQKVGVKYEW